MGQQFDRVAIALTPGGSEYVVLDSQLIIDFGQGQGPKGGAVTVYDGFVSIRGPGEVWLDCGTAEQGGTFPPVLKLTGKGKLAVEIAAHEPPGGPPSKATVYLEGASATLRMRDANGNDHTLLDGAAGNLWLGGKAADGDVVLFKQGETDNRNTAKATIHLDGAAAGISLKSNQQKRIFLDGTNANVWLGGNGANGDVVLFASGGDNSTPSKATVHLDGANGNLRLGGAPISGQPGVAGNLALFPATAKEAEIGDFNKASIHLNGQTGDIILQNADCAEEFDVAEIDDLEPGTVMVLDQKGALRPSTVAYDKRVAGVVSGARHCKPGIILDRKPSQGKRVPLALVGKVFCKIDARYAPIEIGDLLTTSPTPGHAMKATDPPKGFGAVIGKALRALDTGTGLIPVLVALQ